MSVNADHQNTLGGSGRKAALSRFNFSGPFFSRIVFGSAVLVVVILFAITVSLLISSLPSFARFGFSFFTGTTWDPVIGEYGSLPFMVGTIITSVLALAISIPFSLSIAIVLGEYFRSGLLGSILNSAMELLAGIPSIIYGMWGLFFLVPVVRQLQIALGVPPLGIGIFTASLLLAIMIIPYTASISREVISLVPTELKEAGYSLGGTRFDVVRKVILPYSKSGIFAGILLSFGRALGETMAVTMVIGNSSFLSANIFGPGNTISSLIANEFTEAADPLYISALIEAGLVLFVITTVFGFLGRTIVNKTTIQS